jgi:hypothetical protein
MGKLRANDSMKLIWFRKTTDGNVAISNSLDFEDFKLSGYIVECSIDGFEEFKHLTRLPSGTPGCETRYVRKHDGR